MKKMTKTLTKLLNSIIKGKHHHNKEDKGNTYPAITTERGLIISDGYSYIEMTDVSGGRT